MKSIQNTTLNFEISIRKAISYKNISSRKAIEKSGFSILHLTLLVSL